MKHPGSLVVGLLLAASPAEGQLQRFEFTHVAMGTEFRFVMYASDSAHAEFAFTGATHRIDELDQILSDYLPESEVNRLSGTAGSGLWIAVSGDLWDVLRYGAALAAATNGAFDITLGPLTRLWRWSNRRQVLPGADRVARARTTAGYDNLLFDTSEHRVMLSVPGMRLDLGGIGKGFAADRAVEAIRNAGVPHALVDAGGDIAMSEPPPSRTGWRIRVTQSDAGRLISSELSLNRGGIATSGDAYRVFTAEGDTYSHVIDPETGLGVTQPRIVTVIASSATEADALASAVSVLGAIKGIEFLNQRTTACGFVTELEKGAWVQSTAHCQLNTPEPTDRGVCGDDSHTYKTKPLRGKP